MCDIKFCVLYIIEAVKVHDSLTENLFDFSKVKHVKYPSWMNFSFDLAIFSLGFYLESEKRVRFWVVI